jgi:hypothetical protein
LQKFEAVYTPAGKTAKSENRFLIQNIRTFGLTESEIVMDLHNGVKVNISATFYAPLFCTKVFWAAFL